MPQFVGTSHGYLETADIFFLIWWCWADTLLCHFYILLAFVLLTVNFDSYVDELIQELERERCAKIEAERKLKGIKLCYLHCWLLFRLPGDLRTRANSEFVLCWPAIVLNPRKFPPPTPPRHLNTEEKKSSLDLKRGQSSDKTPPPNLYPWA